MPKINPTDPAYPILDVSNPDIGLQLREPGTPILLKIASEQMAGILANPATNLLRDEAEVLAMEKAEALLAEYNRRQEVQGE